MEIPGVGLMDCVYRRIEDVNERISEIAECAAGLQYACGNAVFGDACRRYSGGL